MNRDARKRILTLLTLSLLLLASCAGPSLLGRAKQSAEASYSVYQTINPQVVSQIQAIVEKNRAGTITDADRARLRSLDQLKKDLDEYSKTHNLFVQSLQTWEATNQAPNDAVILENRLLILINLVLDEAKALDLQIPAGLR